MTLTPEHFTASELAFMAHNGLSPSDFLDVTGMSRTRREEAFKATGKRMSLRREGCRRASHRLYTKLHCVQCNPKAMVFDARHYAPGFVYVAHSDCTGLVKVGLCSDIYGRELSLNKQAYAGESDWRILDYRRCAEGGRIETEVKRRLYHYSATGLYTLKATGPEEAREAFWVDTDIALAALREVI